MKKIKVVSGVLQIDAGARVALDKDQAAARAHRLEKVKGEKGTFVARDVLQFKAGEILGVEELAKHKLHRVEELGSAEG